MTNKRLAMTNKRLAMRIRGPRGQYGPIGHCEERQRRSNLRDEVGKHDEYAYNDECHSIQKADCFAALAMTKGIMN